MYKLTRQNYFNKFIDKCKIPLLVIIYSISNLAAIELNGILNEKEWDDAQVFTNFLTVKPYTLKKPEHDTAVKVFANEQGIYFGIINSQPTQLNNLDISARDGFISSDKIQIILDFDNNGISAYAFEVGIGGSIRDGIFSNENQFSNEWDGLWKASTSVEDNFWVAEVMIPWSVVSMNNNTAEFRQIKWYMARSIANKNLTYANAATANTREQFLSIFETLKIRDHSTSSLQVFGYSTLREDIHNNENSVKLGGDLFWKSGNGKQLTATVNPDFGQIESDRLVVNFSATETFFSERRPFFTENQSLFDIRGENGLRLIHTRRIGSRPDLGEQSESDIDLAIKYTDKQQYYTYGVFAATEADGDAFSGRDYFAGSFVKKKRNYTLGLTTTYVNRPDKQRQAFANAIDYEYKWLEKFKINTQMVASSITDDLNENENGIGISTSFHHQITKESQQSVKISHYDKDFEINDFGFLPRNNLNTFTYEYDIKLSDFDENSSLQQKQYRIRFESLRNDMGDILHSSLSFLNSFSFQNSSHISWDITLNSKGIDDLISRGHGLVNTRFGSNIGVSYNSNNANKLRYHGSLRRYDDFESGEEYSIHIHPSYYFKENINLSLGISYSQANNWLNWLNDDLFGRYERKLLNSTLDINANFSPKQELRFRLQWVAIDAKALAQYQLSNQGELTANSQNIDDFSLSRTALQLRYKYEVAPLSNVYFVFSRGARVFNNNSETLFSLFKPGIDNVTSNNFLIKYRHQFL